MVRYVFSIFALALIATSSVSAQTQYLASPAFGERYEIGIRGMT